MNAFEPLRSHLDVTSSREKFSVFVERARHDPICGVECLFNAVTVVHVNVDVEHTRVISQQFQDAKYDVYRTIKLRIS